MEQRLNIIKIEEKSVTTNIIIGKKWGRLDFFMLLFRRFFVVVIITTTYNIRHNLLVYYLIRLYYKTLIYGFED